MKYECITIITKKHFRKIEKKTLQTNIAVNDPVDTRLCGSSAVYRVCQKMTQLVFVRTSSILHQI